MDNTVLYDVTYGMYIIGASDNKTPVGCVANTIAQITSADPAFMISLNKNNYTFKVIEKTGYLSINILSESTRPELIGTFGFQSSADADKYADCKYELIDGIPVITENCCGSMLLQVIKIIDMETHSIVLARLKDAVKNNAGSLIPMTYSYYHNVIKGKASKNAPTYRPEEKKASSLAYVCDICGYIHEGDISTEPEDYHCPICRASKEHFIKA